jgi:hypothetical protein
MLSVVHLYVKCRYADCRYAQCRGTHMGTYSQQFIFFTTYAFCNKLECLFLADLSSLVLCLRVMTEPTL